MTIQDELTKIHSVLTDLAESYDFMSRHSLELKDVLPKLLTDMNAQLTAISERANSVLESGIAEASSN